MAALAFWLLWPYIISRMTERYWLHFTGENMPRVQTARLRRDLAKIARGVKGDNTHR